MTSQEYLFSTLNSFVGEVKTANDNYMKAVGKADIELNVQTTRGNEICGIKDVLLVPELGANMLSIEKNINHRNVVLFEIYLILATITLRDSLYILKLADIKSIKFSKMQ